MPDSLSQSWSGYSRPRYPQAGWSTLISWGCRFDSLTSSQIPEGISTRPSPWSGSGQAIAGSSDCFISTLEIPDYTRTLKIVSTDAGNPYRLPSRSSLRLSKTKKYDFLASWYSKLNWRKLIELMEFLWWELLPRHWNIRNRLVNIWRSRDSFQLRPGGRCYQIQKARNSWVDHLIACWRC